MYYKMGLGLHPSGELGPADTADHSLWTTSQYRFINAVKLISRFTEQSCHSLLARRSLTCYAVGVNQTYNNLSRKLSAAELQNNRLSIICTWRFRMPLRAGFCSSTGELSGLALVVAPHLLTFCEKSHRCRSSRMA
jgi:hypothetical protein